MCGYTPSILQQMLSTFGCWLVLPPWEADDGQGVATLGKINFFVLAASCYYAWSTVVVIILQHSVERDVLRICTDWVILQGFIVILYSYARVGLSQEVMLARNAQRVINLMMRGVLNKNTSSDAAKAIEALDMTLPWLPAHDRRDAVTVRMTLDRLAASMLRTSQVEARGSGGGVRGGSLRSDGFGTGDM
eukprot:4642030-Pleurochrysis_carterae.AAC.1